MALDGIRDQPEAVTLLRRALDTGRVAHAYAFVGPEGSGRKATALAFAEALRATHLEILALDKDATACAATDAAAALAAKFCAVAAAVAACATCAAARYRSRSAAW